MRQTLLAHEMVKVQEHNADKYIDLYIIPEGNKELLDKIVSNRTVFKITYIYSKSQAFNE